MTICSSDNQTGAPWPFLADSLMPMRAARKTPIHPFPAQGQDATIFGTVAARRISDVYAAAGQSWLFTRQLTYIARNWIP